MSPINIESLINNLKIRITNIYSPSTADYRVNTDEINEINEIATLIHNNQQNIKIYFKNNIDALNNYITELGQIDTTSPIYRELTELRSSINRGGKFKKSRRFKKKSRRFKKKSKRRL